MVNETPVTSLGESAEAGEGTVFISYARVDTACVSDLVVMLQERSLPVWIDTSDIRPATEWRNEIYAAIDRAWAFVACVSPAYFRSGVCTDELERARQDGKAVIPVLVDALDGVPIPEWLNALHRIDARTARSRAADLVATAVHADPAWTDEHARLLILARRWDDDGRSPARLLRGRDIANAEAALVVERPAQQPQPSPLHREFVAASRRGRSRRFGLITAVAVVVAAVAVTLAVVAFTQRATARRNEASARRALAESDFRRFSAGATAAPTVSDSLRFALGAESAATAADLTDAEAVGPLIAALARSDVPLAHFAARSDDQQESGDRQGVEVSADGSTLAYISPDSEIHVVDLVSVRERVAIPPDDRAAGDLPFGHQIGLSPDGTQLVSVGVSEYPASLADPFIADVQVFRLEGDRAVQESDATMTLSALAAGVAFGPVDGTVVVAETSGTVTVGTRNDPGYEVITLGVPEFRDAASYLTVNFSLDGSRVCTIGARAQLFQVNPPTQLADLTDGYGSVELCIPEICGDRREDLGVFSPDGTFVCLSAGGPRGRRPTFGSIAEVRGAMLPASTHGFASAWNYAAPDGELAQIPFVSLTIPTDVVRTPRRGYLVPSNGQPKVVSISSEGDVDVWGVSSGFLEPDEQVRDIVEATSTNYRLPGAETLDVGAVDVSSGLIAFATPTGVTLANAIDGLGERTVIEASDVCLVDLSASATSVAAVTCGAQPRLLVGELDPPGEAPRSVPLDYDGPTAVSVADDAKTVVVAFNAGQVAVLRGEQRIEPPSLLVSPAPHNDWQSGWARVDPTGTWMVTRRDGFGTDLWQIGDRSVDRLAVLSHEQRTDPPDYAVFDETSVTIGWSSDPTGGARAATWPLGRSELVERACALSEGQPSDLATQAGVGTYTDPCADIDDPPVRTAPPSIAPSPLASAGPTPAGDPSSPAPSSSTVALPDGSFPRFLDISDDGAVWIGLSSGDAIARLDPAGALTQFPIPGDQNSVGDMVQGPDGAIWFTGFGIVARVDASGAINGLSFTSADIGLPSAIALGPDDAVWYTNESAVPTVNRVSTDFSISGFELPIDASSTDISGLATGPDGALWFTLAFPDSPDAPPDAIGRLTLTGEFEQFTLPGEHPGPNRIAAGADGTLWFTETNARSIGRITVDGEIEVYEVPDGRTPFDITAGVDGAVWFTSETGVGRVSPSGEMASWAVPNARRLIGIAAAPDGTLWVADGEGDLVHHLTPSR